MRTRETGDLDEEPDEPARTASRVNGQLARLKARPPSRARRTSETLILEAAEEAFAEFGYHGASISAIAGRAGLPKANVHYYFGTKDALYEAVLSNILELWLGAVGDITPDSDPAEALSAYIRAKIEYSRTRPLASRVFANELLNGAPRLETYLRTTLRRFVEEKGRVIRAWAEAGKMDPVDPVHLFITLWAMTQTYADFAVQAAAIMGKPVLEAADLEHARDFVTRLVVKGCGVRAG